MMSPDRSVAPPVTDVTDITLPPCSTMAAGPQTTLHVLENGSQSLTRLTMLWSRGTLEAMPASLPAIVFDSMRQGGTQSLSGADVADIVDYCGSRLTARVAGGHHSGLELLALSDRYDRLLPMLHDLVTAPAFAPQAVAATTRDLAAARATARAKVSFEAATALATLIHGDGHPAARSDTPDEILAVTPADAAACHRATVNRDLHVFLAGNVTPRLLDSITGFLGSIRQSDADTTPTAIIPDSPSAPVRRDIVHPDALQSAVAIGLPVPSVGRDNPDYIPLRLAVMALGGYFGSRLVQNLRERRGLTYGISAALIGTPEGTSVSISAQCDPAYTDILTEETLAEVRRIAAEPPQGDELRRLRRHAFTALASTLDSPFDIMDHYVTRLVVGTPDDYFSRQVEILKSLTPEILSDVACRHLDPGAATVVTCGPER